MDQNYERWAGYEPFIHFANRVDKVSGGMIPQTAPQATACYQVPAYDSEFDIVSPLRDILKEFEGAAGPNRTLFPNSSSSGGTSGDRPSSAQRGQQAQSVARPTHGDSRGGAQNRPASGGGRPQSAGRRDPALEVFFLLQL